MNPHERSSESLPLYVADGVRMCNEPQTDDNNEKNLRRPVVLENHTLIYLDTGTDARPFDDRLLMQTRLISIIC